MTPGCRSKSIIGLPSMMGRGRVWASDRPRETQALPELAHAHQGACIQPLDQGPRWFSPPLFEALFDFPCRLFDASHRALNFIPHGSIA